jgi:hypothetical protein
LQSFLSLGFALGSLMHYWGSHVNGCFLVLHSWCFGAIYCCCPSLVATFMMLSLDKLLLFAAAVAVY